VRETRGRLRTVLFSSAQCEQCPSVPLTRQRRRGTLGASAKGVFSMAKCPACEREVATPFVLNVDKWRWLACPHCAARLERKNPRYAVAMTSFFVALLSLGRLGHRFAIVAEALMIVIFVVILVDFMRPQLQLRKPLPKAEIELKIGDPPN
jgi:hypothetical protein